MAEGSWRPQEVKVGFSIAISAGETSGDLNGAFLIKELKKLRSDLTIWGAGGNAMRESGAEIVVDMVGGGTIGIAETLKTLPAVAVKYHMLRRLLLKRHPDVFVPIDFGAFNIRLAQIAHKNGINVVYYFPPSSWRRHPKNASKLIACGGKVITPFPWSAEFLCNEGVDARFVGHPLIDIARPDKDKSSFLKELGLSDALPTIGLLPGSRAHEIREHLMPMIESAQIIDRELGGAQFIIAAAGRCEKIKKQVYDFASDKDSFPEVRIVERRTYDCMSASDFLIAASGTATLEAAIIGVPMVIIYRGSAIMRFEFLFRKSVIEDHIGMPNIVADRGVCPEMINDDVTAEKLADITVSILRSKERMNKMKSELSDVKIQLGKPGAAARAAQAVIEMGCLE